jgi:hypothetical protein
MGVEYSSGSSECGTGDGKTAEVRLGVRSYPILKVKSPARDLAPVCWRAKRPFQDRDLLSLG